MEPIVLGSIPATKPVFFPFFFAVGKYILFLLQYILQN